MSQKPVKAGLSKANVNAIALAIGTATLNRLVPIFSTSVAYKKGQYTNYNNQLYRFTADKSAGAWDSTKVESASLNDLINDVNEAVATINNKANVDGNYPTLTAGNADQLNSTVYVVDKVPYLYRTSGGDADIGNREYDKIIGGSLVVNQLFNPRQTFETVGATITNETANGHAIKVNGTVSGLSDGYAYLGIQEIGKEFSVIAGHKYLFKGITAFFAKATVSNQSCIHIPVTSGGAVMSPSTNGLQQDTISTCTQSSTSGKGIYLLIYNDDVFDNAILDLNIIDLTAMFGPTIADYIYALEQANAGAGVAWFRNYFKEEYYPFNSGAIKNVKLISHDMVGFNQWDEQWELGIYNSSTGEKETNSTNIRCKNKIKVIPNATYYQKAPINQSIKVLFYDANDNFISTDTISTNITFVIPSNAIYMAFNMTTTYGTTYNNDICINLSWSGWRNGQYEPYKKNSYPLDTTIELRGIPKLDSNNHLYFDGDEYSSDGKVVRKYGVSVDLGTIDWELTSAGLNWVPRSYRLTDAKYPVNQQTKPSLICNKYEGEALDTLINHTKTGIGVSGAGWMYLWDDNLPLTMTPEQVKQALSGVYVYFELATPTEETAAPFQEPQIVDDFGTEEYVVPTQDGWQVPVGHDTKYPTNLRDKLQRLPDMPSVSQNVTETYVVNYNGTTKKCTFVDIDTWLGSNGYVKQEDLSNQITDVAGLTYSLRKAVKIGSLITMTIRFVNNTGSQISPNVALFNIGSPLIPSENIVVPAFISDEQSTPNCVVSAGYVVCQSAIPNGKTVVITMTYIK